MSDNINYWNYRLIRLTSNAYSIGEVYYDDSSNPILWTDDIYGDTPHITPDWEDKIMDYSTMLFETEELPIEKTKDLISTAFLKPVLDVRELPGFIEMPMGIEDDGLFTREE